MKLYNYFLINVLFLVFLGVHPQAKADSESMAGGLATKVPVPEGAFKISDDIEDNSFLVEEAFNQEKGVEQHIQSFQFMKDGSYFYSFTEESPVGGRKHQLSVTVPYVQTSNDSGQQKGFGDTDLNYRYQLIDGERFFVSPRFSILFPTGDYRKGTGMGATGYQVNIPVSLKLNRYFISHWNVGSTYTPGRKVVAGSSGDSLVTASPVRSYDSLSMNYGASLIWLAHHNFNLMFETVAYTDQLLDDSDAVNSQTTLFVNPGARYAFNFDSGLQIVTGLSFPLGVGRSAGNDGVLTYLSFEHPMF